MGQRLVIIKIRKFVKSLKQKNNHRGMGMLKLKLSLMKKREKEYL
jgi:hypothetical protein